MPFSKSRFVILFPFVHVCFIFRDAPGSDEGPNDASTLFVFFLANELLPAQYDGSLRLSPFLPIFSLFL